MIYYPTENLILGAWLENFLGWITLADSNIAVLPFSLSSFNWHWLDPKNDVNYVPELPVVVKLQAVKVERKKKTNPSKKGIPYLDESI